MKARCGASQRQIAGVLWVEMLVMTSAGRKLQQTRLLIRMVSEVFGGDVVSYAASQLQPLQL